MPEKKKTASKTQKRPLSEKQPVDFLTKSPVVKFINLRVGSLKSFLTEKRGGLATKLASGQPLVKALKPVLPFFLPLLLVCFSLFIIFLSLARTNPFEEAKRSLARHQNDFDAHLVLAKEFLKNNQIEEAEKELFLIRQIDPDHPRYKKLWQQKLESQPQDIARLIDGWEKILAVKPDYRDAHLKLAILYYKIGETEIARFHLNEALNLDPNFEPSKALEAILNRD